MAIFAEICNPEKDLHLHQHYQKLTSKSNFFWALDFDLTQFQPTVSYYDSLELVLNLYRFSGMVRILTITVAVGQILLLIFNFLKMKKPLIYYGIQCIVSNLRWYLVPSTFCHIFIQFIGHLFLKNSSMGVTSVYQSYGS